MAYQLISLENRTQVIDFLGKRGFFSKTTLPFLECDFKLAVNIPESDYFSGLSTLDPSEIITDMSFPSVGVSFSSGSELMGFPNFSIGYATMEIVFHTLPNVAGSLTRGLSIFHALYHGQFTTTGLLKIIPTASRPSLKISGHYLDQTQEFVEFTGCRFSYPTPTVGVGSTEFSRFKTTVAFETFKTLG